MRAMTSTADERDDPRAAYRLQQLRRHLVCRPATAAASELGGPLAAAWCKAADNTSVQDASKVVSAEEAAALIPDGVWLTPAGFVGTSCPEALLNAVRCGACIASRLNATPPMPCCQDVASPAIRAHPFHTLFEPAAAAISASRDVLQAAVRGHGPPPRPRPHLRRLSRQLQGPRCGAGSWAGPAGDRLPCHPQVPLLPLLCGAVAAGDLAVM